MARGKREKEDFFNFIFNMGVKGKHSTCGKFEGQSPSKHLFISFIRRSELCFSACGSCAEMLGICPCEGGITAET